MITWDIKIGDVIDCFDPNFSYEISHYRPVTETRGLDFDPTPFTEVGQVKLKTGRYTMCPHNSK